MTQNLPLLGSIKKQEERRFLTYIIKRNSPKEYIKKKSEISFNIHKVNSAILKRLEVIAKLYKAPIKVKIDHSSPAFLDVEDGIKETFSILLNGVQLRIVIKFDNYESTELEDIVNDIGISHIIEIDATGEKKDGNSICDLNTGSITCATVYTSSLPGIYNIIEDVMVDIAMYHTVITPHLKNAEDDLKSSFSYLKVNYAQKNKLQSKNWDSNTHKGYVSLAGYFRNASGFDYGGYIKCWSKILDDVKQKYPNQLHTIEYGIEEQLKRHINYKHLPVKRIIKLYNKLPTGNYLLLAIAKRPKQRKRRATILTYFPGKYWRKGKVNFVPFDKIDEVSRYANWITIFQINK